MFLTETYEEFFPITGTGGYKMFLTYLKKKAPGYYVCVGAATISLAAALTYIIGFSSDAMSKYLSVGVFFLSLAAFLCVGGLSVVDMTLPFAPLAGGLLTLASQCLCIRTVYMYFTEMFYNGVSMEAIAALDKSFVVYFIFTIIAVIAYIVSLFMAKTKREKKETNDEK